MHQVLSGIKFSEKSILKMFVYDTNFLTLTVQYIRENNAIYYQDSVNILIYEWRESV